MQLTLNKNQTRVLMRALELFSRIGIAQFSAISNMFRMYDTRVTDFEKYDKAEKLLDEAKAVLFDLTPNQSYSIHNEKVGEEYRVSWDIMTVIRHELWKQGAMDTHTVDAYKPEGISEEPLPTVQM